MSQMMNDEQVVNAFCLVRNVELDAAQREALRRVVREAWDAGVSARHKVAMAEAERVVKFLKDLEGFFSVALCHDFPENWLNDFRGFEKDISALLEVFPAGPRWIVQLQGAPEPCWIAEHDGDPGRTCVEESAQRFLTEEEAEGALAEAREYRPYRGAKVVKVPGKKPAPIAAAQEASAEESDDFFD